MTRINKNYEKLSAGYLFPEIAKRTRQFLENNPDAQIMRLGIGNTTEPLTTTITQALHEAVDRLGNVETYSGYGDEQGDSALREALVERYSEFGVQLDADEFFISDGAKCDSANIQSIFWKGNVVAVQDPAYPVYVDTAVIGGNTGAAKDGQYQGIVYMPCTEDNGFFPDVPDQKVDLIYICSPNNPTGAVATFSQLQGFVDYAITNKSVIIFDSAYAAFIQDQSLPRSIYQIEGAEKCAIEINSFSKEAGFTGVRLGWSIVPKTLECEDAQPGVVHKMWHRRQTTMFNGASNIVQPGGLAALSEAGQKECRALIDYYMANARTIRAALEKLGFICFGGENAPYVWLKTPDGISSWEFFDKLLNETHVVGTPGSGFGPSGEGYFRLSAFGHKQDIETAVQSIRDNLKL